MLLSPTKNTTYTQCPREYLIRYVYKIAPEETPGRRRGAKVHRVYPWFHEEIRKNSGFKETFTNEGLRGAFNTFRKILIDFLPGETQLCSNIALIEARRLQESFNKFPGEDLQFILSEIFSPVFVETSFLRPYADDIRVSILAVPDAIYRGTTPKGFIIEERKTGSSPNGEVPLYTKIQLLMQSLAFEQGIIYQNYRDDIYNDSPQFLLEGRKVLSLTMIYLDGPSRITFTPTPKDYRFLIQHMIKVGEGIAARVFPASENCDLSGNPHLTCGYQALCRSPEFVEALWD